MVTMITYNQDLKIFYSDKINGQEYFAGFTTKAVGDARKQKTILDFFEKENIQYKNIAIPNQTHSTNVKMLGKNEIRDTIIRLEDADGVITTLQNVILTVVTADCVPIIFADKKAQIIGISHQGWRGSLEKIAVQVVQKMLKIGAKLTDITVAIGPAIGDCCYNIDKDRYLLFNKKFKSWNDKIFILRKKKIFLNLSHLNYLQLLDIGIKKENIDFFPFCTSCDKTRFFSYRRDTKEDFGEMFSFIVRKNSL